MLVCRRLFGRVNLSTHRKVDSSSAITAVSSVAATGLQTVMLTLKRRQIFGYKERLGRGRCHFIASTEPVLR